MKHKKVYARGQRHDDEKRAITVYAFRGGAIGVELENKQTNGTSARFSCSRDGAKILAALLQRVLRGNIKRWHEPKWEAMVWTQVQTNNTVEQQIQIEAPK